MDPNTALEEARGLAFAIENDLIQADDFARLALELAEQFSALDEWIATGGFLPDAWRPEARFHA